MDIIRLTIIKPPANTKPAPIPAINKSPTDVFVAIPYIIKETLGGIITPRQPADVQTAVANGASYPSSFIAGIIRPPTAETVAAAAPLKAP